MVKLCHHLKKAKLATKMFYIDTFGIYGQYFFFLREKNTPLRKNFRRTLREDSDPYVKIS